MKIKKTIADEGASTVDESLPTVDGSLSTVEESASTVGESLPTVGESVPTVDESVSTAEESASPKTGGIPTGILRCLMNTRLRRGGAFAVTIAVHIVLLFFTALAFDVKANPLEMPANIFKLADIREAAPVPAPPHPTPVPPPPKPPAPRPRRETPPPKPVEPEAVPVPVMEPEPISETVVEVEDGPVEEPPVVEVAETEEVTEEPAEYAEEAAETEAEEAPAPVEVAADLPSGGPPVQAAETYLPQNQVSVMPVFNERDIRSRLAYPPIALRSGIEGTVYLELYIDSGGNVRRVEILKEDPTGRGFGEAAVNAFTGLHGKPAEANGKLVAVRYRYPVRFKIQN
jgi:protein TonB